MSSNVRNYKFTTEEEIIEHEKFLYKMFHGKSPTGWIVNNYSLIDNCRLRSTIPYENQKLYGIKQGDRLLATMATNFDCTKEMDLEKMGYSRDKIDESKRICEWLTFCSDGMHLGITFFDILENFVKFIVEEMRKEKIEVAYGVCAEKLKRFYNRAGFKMIDSILINGQKTFLMEFDLSKEP